MLEPMFYLTSMREKMVNVRIKVDFEGECLVDKTIKWLGYKVDKKQA